MNEQPIEKTCCDNGETLDVADIFYSIQGEGPDAGAPAVFIRLAGCNLKCYFCDTDYTSVRQKMTVDEIVRQCCSLINCLIVDCIPTEFVVITGGEPFRQNITKLVNGLHEAGFFPQVETNGTCGTRGLNHHDMSVICSPKGPIVHHDIKMCVSAAKYVGRAGELDENDGLPIGLYRFRDVPIFLQPMDEKDPIKTSANLEAVIESCKKFGHILSLQIHKIIGVE